MKGEINSSIAIVGYFNTLLSIINRISRKIINKEIENLKNTINQLDLTYIYRTLHPTAVE